MYDRSRRLFISLPDLLSDLPRRLRQRGYALHRNGKRALALLLHIDFAHHSCGDHSAVRDCDVETRASRGFPEAPARRAMDLSDVVVRISHRRDRLLHALPLVPGAVTPHQWETPLQLARWTV